MIVLLMWPMVGVRSHDLCGDHIGPRAPWAPKGIRPNQQAGVRTTAEIEL